MSENNETSPQIHRDLKRYPYLKKDLLQAWDTADDLLLEHIRSLDLAGKKILILNDSFGALTRGLQEFETTTYTDSYLSAKGIEMNCGSEKRVIHSLEDFEDEYDYVLARVPKNMSFFEDQLCHLSAHLHAGSKLICGYMVKHQANTSFDLIQKYIGATTTSLAKKKARLIFAGFERKPVKSPYPLQVPIESFKPAFIHHSNLFSREKLDIGTRFFLEHIPEEDYRTILDLGCANGIVGIAAKKKNPRAKIIFTDESQMAVESARVNYRNFFPKEADSSAEFQWTNAYEKGEPDSVDLVLCNPPFHQGNTLGDQAAWEMFKDAYRVLKSGGLLRVVGNSHLQYQVILKKIFGASEVIAKNSKFMIVDAIKE